MTVPLWQVARRRASLVLAVVLLTLAAARPSHAQTSSRSIVGVVLDPDGKVIVDAAVLVRNEATSQLRTTSTDGRGHFSVSELEPGTYTIEIAVPGFDIVRKINVQVTDGRGQDISIQLTVANINEVVTVSAALPAAAAAAPSQASLTARSAQSLISTEYIRNYTSPVSDYSQVLQMAPGTFSASSNGPGLGDTKTFFRGLKDGYYTIAFDGIPFGDTNDQTHHSWVFFPAQTIGSTVFDRSPGSAATIGQSNYGGTVNLLSQPLPARREISGTASYGSFNTRLFDLSFDSGEFGGGTSRLLIEGHEMRSDGYQTYNYQKRDAFQAKYQYTANDRTVLTAFSSVMDLHSNTPDQKGSTRAQIQQFGDKFLMNNDATSALYYRYNFYHVPTHFEYVGVRTDLGHGWSIDDKLYTMRYHNKQNFNSPTKLNATSGTDKLNAYWKVGNLLPVSHASELGVFRTGLWSEYASSNRYQIPSDPRTWIDAPVPNFHEAFHTTTLQPYAEYEVRAGSRLTVTPGLKYAYLRQNFTQFADNGTKIGDLGGAPSTQHTVEYHAWLPSLDARYMVQPYWSVYGQYGRGQNNPPTSIFDVKGALVATVPKPIMSDTFQVGSVWKSRRATLDVDAYRIRLQNDYSSNYDTTLQQTVYFVGADTVTKGVEAESTLLMGGGLAVYLNATLASAKYVDTGLWKQNAPGNTESVGLTFNRNSWNVGFFSKRIGRMYNDNGDTHQAVAIDPFGVTNLFVNYTLRGSSMLSQSKVRFSVNNLTDSHAITAVSPASKTSSAPAPGDVVTLMSGRSISVSLTVGLSPKP